MATCSRARLLGSLLMLRDRRGLGLVRPGGRLAMIAPTASRPR
jgi:hypothetical protein